MRELKFRAWNKRKKFYLYDVQTMGFDDYIRENGIEQEVEQYTGLKDKNGREIYEGDIIKYAWTRCNYIVVYRKYDTSFVLENDNREEIICFQYTQQTDYEVIGNIHENPELLEAE